MARDIEEFLRRAAERRKQQKQGGAPKPPPRQQPPRQQPPRQQSPPQRKPPQRQPPKRQPVRQPPVEAEIVDAVPVSRRRQQPKTRPPQKKKPLREQNVAKHVRNYIDVSDVSARADTLGDRIESVHDQVEATVHQHLDHDLTELDDTQSITELPPPKIFGAKSDAFAEELRQMLAQPKMVGKAIILAEILKRPEF